MFSEEIVSVFLDLRFTITLVKQWPAYIVNITLNIFINFETTKGTPGNRNMTQIYNVSTRGAGRVKYTTIP